MNGESAVVLDETELSEFVHEKTDARSCGPHHFGQDFLANFGNDGLGPAFLAILREQQQRASEAPFAGIEKLIHEIGFKSNIARQDVGDKSFRKSVFVAKHAHHGALADFKDGARCNRGCRSHSKRLPGQAPLSEKIAVGQDGDHSFLCALGKHRELDASLLDVKDFRGFITLGKHDLLVAVLHDLFAQSTCSQEIVKVESRGLW